MRISLTIEIMICKGKCLSNISTSNPTGLKRLNTSTTTVVIIERRIDERHKRATAILHRISVQHQHGRRLAHTQSSSSSSSHDDSGSGGEQQHNHQHDDHFLYFDDHRQRQLVVSAGRFNSDQRESSDHLNKLRFFFCISKVKRANSRGTN